MMCEECSIRPAKFHLTTISQEEKTERNLCPVCMAKYQKQLPGLDFSNLAGLISGFLESASSTHDGEQHEEGPEISCSSCGTTYANFQKTGMLGCAHCYEEFRKPLDGLLMRVHGNTQHAGRIPGGIKSDVSIRMNLDRLRQNLVRAIADEEYEEAAKLRDQIRSLKQQLEPVKVDDEGGDRHG
jgi:protein arginine kinase activator